ncbi:uncharacterized protein LOC127875964 isoform X1 [Dreissena polymorpha]|uniref:Uncharacterized protein n=1 Tax=Dreissena polymorpha TaxID=45954 RepID=A0A9D4QIE3_DREPO|nr:uncharacterized protein LOC127875964 isoform X1 [Dreissena polymorpha]XP_052276703.1 uncharacterized protein LOC127875964 isoform X1 [Dreissena polymorpha]XP_052276704.1 uncharacterized protein LOC127875964 isoform X1 [Dreissena polymorpha]KAH3833038.1 hypothetical protein DPMN_106340 [Dreissena polymorpha]
MSARNRRTSQRVGTADENPELKTIKECLGTVREEQMSQKTILNNVIQAQTMLSENIDTIQETLESLKSEEPNTFLSEKVDAIQKTLKSLEMHGLPNGGGADVVSLQENRTGNPAHTILTEPSGARNIPGKKPRRSKRQRICAMSPADLPGEPLFKNEPEENDIINKLKAFRVDVNNSTIQSVLGATKVPPSPTSTSAASTLLVVDSSLSMKGKPFQELITFVNGFIDELDRANVNHGLEERLAVVMCGSPTTVLQPFTTQYDDIRGILDQCAPDGKTPLLTALTLALCYIDGRGEALQLGENTLLTPRVIVLSDFNPTDDKEPFDNEDEETGEENKTIQRHLIQLAKIYCRQMLGLYCVPVGRNKNKKFARELADNSYGGEMVSAENFESAGHYLRNHVIAARVCDDVEASIARNEDIDVEEILKEIMSEAKCGGKDKDAIVKVIVKLRSGSEPAPAPCEEKPKKDSGSDRPKKRHHKKVRQANPETLQKYKEYIEEKKKRPEMLPVLFDDTGMVEWKQTKMESIGYEEFPILPPLGSRVKRGPDWTRGEDDGHMPGTVVGHFDHEMTIVLFDNDKLVYCKYNKEGKYDIEKIDEPRRVPRDHIEIGCSVKRGPNWRKENEDGGPESVGAVLRKSSGRMVMVRWPNGIVKPYKFGQHHRYEVEVTNEPTNFKNEDVVENAADSGLTGEDAAVPTSGATSGQSKADKMPWWKWKDSQQCWRPFSEEAVNTLEEAKNKNQQFVQVQYKGKDFRVLFNENKCEFDGGRFDVARELINDDDKMSMIEMDKYLSAI